MLFSIPAKLYNVSNPVIQNEMSTLLSCLSKAKTDGYTINYIVTEDGLSPSGGTTFYQPEEVQIDNFYRFEGNSDPDENVILYLIHANDGNKGTLTNAYGMYADPLIASFVEQVKDITKQ